MATILETLAIAVEHHQAGRLEEAEQLYRQVLAADPREPNAWHLLGVLSTQFDRHDDGVDCLRRALALRPDWPEALYNLGWALRIQAKLDEAAASLRRAIELKPDYCEAHDTLGVVLQDQGRHDQAAACHRQALELDPGWVAAYNHLGLALAAQGKAEEAEACYREAIRRKPGFAAAHENLGALYTKQMRLGEAVACYQRALGLDPNRAYVHASLGNAWMLSGSVDEAVACLRRAAQLEPRYMVVHSDLLRTLQFRSSVTLQELAEAHAEFERRHCAGLRATWRPHKNFRDPQRRLRIGFPSYDFHRHPVGYFLIAVLENLNRRQCEAVCYYYGREKDDLTARFQAAATWSEVQDLTNEQLAERIRDDQIDILFDLSGHSRGSRLPVFARKPAPIQITWIGYEATTGLAAMDYILADRYEIPPQSEPYYCERVLRMPDGYLCFDPPNDAPPVSPLPAIEKGHVTFAAFHNPPKITRQVVQVWAQILKRLPQARLVLKYAGMDDPAVARRFAGLFAAEGVDPARLEFLGFSIYGERFAQWQRMDVALDTFPYNGCTTTCEALWMGVPVVAFPGETFASRASLSHLSVIGLTETVAGDLQQYADIAVGMANDLPRLAALRAGLRQRMAASPLCDGKRFAANFANVLRDVWRDWCEKGD